MENKKIYFWAVLSKIVIVLITILSTALINRNLGVNLKGEYAYVINIVNILEVVFSLGVGITYATFKRKSNVDKNIFVSLTIYISAIVLLIALGFMLINSNVSLILLLTSFTIIKNNYLTIAAIEDVKKRDKKNILFKTIYLLFVTLIYFYYKEKLLLVYVAYLIDCIITGTVIFKAYNFKLLSIKDIINNNFKSIVTFGLLSMQMQLLISFNYNLDIIVLKKMSNSYYVGLYSVAVFLSNMLWIIPDAFKDVLFHKTSKNDSINEIVFLTKINLIIAFIGIVGFSIFGKLFINVLYGVEFTESYYPTLVLFVGGLSMIIYKMIHPLYVSKGKQKIVMVILLVAVILNLFLNILLIPKYNIYGAAVSSVFSYTLCSFIFIYIFRKDYKITVKELLFLNKKDIEIIRSFLKNK